jgi:Cys-tRNA(Pro)/Cys-tRNA(Cys) deacylase
MMKPAEAERISGYKVGGIGPFGQMRALPTAIEDQAMTETLVTINGRQRGLQVRLSPRDAVTLPKAIVAPLVV